MRLERQYESGPSLLYWHGPIGLWGRTYTDFLAPGVAVFDLRTEAERAYRSIYGELGAARAVKVATAEAASR